MQVSKQVCATVVADPGGSQQWGHRNVTSRVSEFLGPDDGRVLRLMFDPHQPEEYYSPRHHHNFDQLRFVTDGEVQFGERLVAHARDLVYFPAGTRYGITVKSSSCAVLTVQTHGPEWAYFPTRAEAERGSTELRARGTLDRDKGMFQWPDGRRQDTYEAMWEQLTGKPLTYPEPRFAEPCLIHSAAFAWLPTQASGVEHKPLARFNSIGPEVSLLRLASGAKLPRTSSKRHEVYAVLGGRCRYAERDTLVLASRFYVPPGAERSELLAEEETELLVIAFEPKAGSAPAL